MKRPIEECWKIYAGGALPPDTPPANLQGLRSAFFCGVYTMRELMATNHKNLKDKPREVAQQEFTAWIGEIDAELTEFIEQSRERAGGKE